MGVKIVRMWCRKVGTDRVFQVTQKIAEREPPRIGADLIMISEQEARTLQAKSEKDKKQTSIDKRQAPISKALAQLQSRQADVEFEAEERAKLNAAIASQQKASGQPHTEVSGDPTPAASTMAAAIDPNLVPETPEQVAARLEAMDAGADGETGAVPDGYRDELEGKNRSELMGIIDELKEQGAEITKKGTNKALVAAIRETRKLVAAAQADADRQAAAASE